MRNARNAEKHLSLLDGMKSFPSRDGLKKCCSHLFPKVCSLLLLLADPSPPNRLSAAPSTHRDTNPLNGRPRQLPALSTSLRCSRLHLSHKQDASPAQVFVYRSLISLQIPGRSDTNATNRKEENREHKKVVTLRWRGTLTLGLT